MVLGVLVVSFSLFSGQVASPAVEAPPARWSVGTGLGLFEGTGLAALGSLSGGLLNTALLNVSPAPRVTFERLINDRLTLGLGLVAQYGKAVEGGTEQGSVSALLGPRWIFTNPESPIALSGYVAGLVGYGVVAVSQVAGGTLTLGGVIGAALERVLIDRLALRLQLQLLRVTWSESWQTGALAAQVSHNTQVSFIPGPSLELRFYF